MNLENVQKINEPMFWIDSRTEKRKDVKIFGQIAAAVSVCIAVIGAGTTLSWTSPCLNFLENHNSTASFHISKEEGSWIGSLLAIGALISSIPAGICGDKFGRKNSILSLCVPYILSWILIIKSTNVWMIYIGRIIIGIGVGGACTLVPMYLAEITEDVTRGPICSLFPMFFTVGILFTYIINIWAEYYLLSYILLIIPIIFGISFIFMPESPIYLVKNGQEKEAKKALLFLRGERYDINLELLEIKKELSNRIEEKATFFDIFRNRIYFRKCMACIILFLFQQLSGSSPIIFYTVPIFKAANSSLDPLLCSILVTSIQLLVTILFIYVVDKLGRKVYMILSAIIMAICLLFVGLYFHLQALNIYFPYLDIIPLTSLMIFVFALSLGVGPIPWIFVGEVNTPEIIGIISGISMVVNWFLVFVVTKSFPPMLAYLGAHWTFYLFSSCNFLSIVFVTFFVPETRFKLANEIFVKK